MGKLGKPVWNVDRWRAAYARHQEEQKGCPERYRIPYSHIYKINWNNPDEAPELHKLWLSTWPGSVRQHVRCDREITQYLEEDIYRRQCKGYDRADMPKDDYVPPLKDEYEIEADKDGELLSPAGQAPETTEVEHIPREEVTMVHTLATTDLISNTRQAVSGSRTKKWMEDETRNVSCAAGVASGSVDRYGQKMQLSRQVLEAKQLKWSKAGLHAAKQYAVHTVAHGYPKHPLWIPEFWYSGSACGEEVILNRKRKLVWNLYSDNRDVDDDFMSERKIT